MGAMSSPLGRLFVLSVVVALGGATGHSLSHAQPPIMPQGMIDACKSLADGAPCQFEVGGKVIDGLCSPLPNAELACRPGTKAKRAKVKPQQP